MKTIIIVTDGKRKARFKSLVSLCHDKRFSYHYLKRKKFPIKYKGMLIEKVNKNDLIDKIF